VWIVDCGLCFWISRCGFIYFGGKLCFYILFDVISNDLLIVTHVSYSGFPIKCKLFIVTHAEIH